MSPGARPSGAEYLREQVYFLESSARGFDGGHFAESRRLATTVRVLVHDTRQSRSLLSQMDIKQRVLFPVFGQRFDPDAYFQSPVLTTMVFHGARMQYEPRLVGEGFVADARFDDWWNGDVIRTVETPGSGPATFTRKMIVLALANKEGGAHVDETLSAEYQSMAYEHGIGWQIFEEGQAEGRWENTSPVPATMRTIAQEVLEVLYRLGVPRNYVPAVSDPSPG